MKFGESVDNVLFKNYFNLEGKATKKVNFLVIIFKEEN